jgi:hypothetical protein
MSNEYKDWLRDNEEEEKLNQIHNSESCPSEKEEKDKNA